MCIQESEKLGGKPGDKNSQLFFSLVFLWFRFEFSYSWGAKSPTKVGDETSPLKNNIIVM
jgi:hypothetical protein